MVSMPNTWRRGTIRIIGPVFLTWDTSSVHGIGGAWYLDVKGHWCLIIQMGKIEWTLGSFDA